MVKPLARAAAALLAAALATVAGGAGGGARPAAAAQLSKVTLGVLLPTTVADSEQRFALGQKLATALGTAMHTTVTARNFAHYADFAQAAAKGELDIGIVDAWIAAEADKLIPVATAVVNGKARQPWVVAARAGHSVAELRGKRLAVARGQGALDAQFVANVIFERALANQDLPQLTFVPAAESALKMYDVASADAVLLPLGAAPHAQVIYQSAPLPLTAVVTMRATPPKNLVAALESLPAVAPFDRFSSAGAAEIRALRAQIAHGPPARVPPLAEPTPLRLDVRQLVTFRGVGATLPSFSGYVAVPNEMPND